MSSMHFALLGDHPDGLNLARALAATGRHELAALSGLSTAGTAWLRRHGLGARPGCTTVADFEEVLADPRIEAVIVASRLASRPIHLRRALQAERHVLCVHPPDHTSAIAYEAALIQQDTKQVLLPILTETLHPAVVRLRELLQMPEGPLASFRWIRLESWSPAAFFPEGGVDVRPSFADWGVLRFLGGEIAEVAAFTTGAEITEEAPLFLSGRFVPGGLLQATLVCAPELLHWHLSVVGTTSGAELTFPTGWSGPARLQWRDQAGTTHEESWEAWDPWPAFVNVFESAGAAASTPAQALVWQDCIRALELDDAARRGVERGRSSVLEFPEASEEVGFKGTMTLAGCGLLWAIVLVLILSNWFPALGLFIAPVLLFFLILQTLRWFILGKQAVPGTQGTSTLRRSPPAGGASERAR